MLGARGTGGRAVTFLQVLISGISQGCIYALIALGFVLIYKATETVNFAQGELMMLGAFAGLALMEVAQLPFFVAAVLAIGAMAAFGVLLERVAIRPILGQPQFTIVMLTIGIGYMARGLMTMVPRYGSETHAMPAPYKGQVWRFGALVISVEQVAVIVVTVVLCALLYLMFNKSRVGIAMQASSQNQLAAYYMGIPVQRLNGLVWGLSAAVAAIAGLLLAPWTFVHVNMGSDRAEGVPGRGGRRLRQPAGRDRRRPDHRRDRVDGGAVHARRLQGHRGLRGGAADAGDQAQRLVRWIGAEEGLTWARLLLAETERGKAAAGCAPALGCGSPPLRDPCAARSHGPPRNSLRDLRSLRSNSLGESDDEARCARGHEPCAPRRRICRCRRTPDHGFASTH